jgi:hypothetical protein
LGCDTGAGGGHRANGFRVTDQTLLNEEDMFDGDVVQARLTHDSEKSRRRWEEVVPRQFGKRQKNETRGIYSRAAY